MTKKPLVDPHTGYAWLDSHRKRDHWVRKVIYHGKQYLINIPMDLLREMNLERGAYVMFKREKGVITLSVLPIVKTREELEEL